MKTYLIKAVERGDAVEVAKILAGRSIKSNSEFLIYFTFYAIAWLMTVTYRALTGKVQLPKLYTFKSYIDDTIYYKHENLEGYDQLNALHIAAFLGNLECVRVLVAGGADVDATMPGVDTPTALCLAVRAKKLAIIKELISANATVMHAFYEPDLNASSSLSSKYRLTYPLFAAIDNCQLYNDFDFEIIRALSGIASTNLELRSRAYQLNLFDAFELLVEPCIANRVCPIAHAILSRKENSLLIVQILLTNGFSPNTQLYLTSESDRYKGCLRGRGFIRSSRNSATPLSIAIGLRLKDVAALLLRNGAVLMLSDTSNNISNQSDIFNNNVISRKTLLCALSLAALENIILTPEQLGTTQAEREYSSTKYNKMRVAHSRNNSSDIQWYDTTRLQELAEAYVQILQQPDPIGLLQVNLQPGIAAQAANPAPPTRLTRAFNFLRGQRERLLSPVEQARLQFATIAQIPARTSEIQQAKTQLLNLDPDYNFIENMEFAVCPITREVMINPVNNSLGYTYEQAAIENWFAFCRANNASLTDPKTGQAITDPSLSPIYALKQAILTCINSEIARLNSRSIISIPLAAEVPAAVVVTDSEVNAGNVNLRPNARI